jgi:hypothetical protein
MPRGASVSMYVCGLEQVSCGFSVSARKWKGAQEELGERQGHKVLRATRDARPNEAEAEPRNPQEAVSYTQLIIRPPKKQTRDRKQSRRSAPRGEGRRKKLNNESDVHLPQPKKTKELLITADADARGRGRPVSPIYHLPYPRLPPLLANCQLPRALGLGP